MEKITMPTYSIVIPVYNAERYLENCIDSIFAQTSCSDYEVILVNDGSKDRSPEICDRYAEQVPAVKVIHQVNQGVSAARNAGISAARGTYILFLDADDYWDARFLQLLDDAISKNPDMIEFGYRYFCADHAYEPVLPAVHASGLTGVAYIEAHENINCMPIASCWAAAFRRQFLEDNDIRFPLGVAYGEDFDFHMHCLKAAERVFTVREPLYWYRMNESGATHTITVKKIRDMLSTCAKVYRLFPCALFANYYCKEILRVEKLSKNEALQLNELLLENRDILQHVSGTKSRIACILYKTIGWYHTSKFVKRLLDIRDAQKG